MAKFLAGVMLGGLYASCVIIGIIFVKPLLIIPMVITVVSLIVFIDYLCDNWGIY